MAQHRIVEAERTPDLVDHVVVALNVEEHVVRLVNLVDGMGQLAATPVFGAMDRTAGTGDHALVAFDHGRHLLALVRMDQEYDFVMSHCRPFWMKSARLPRRITATRLPGVARAYPAANAAGRECYPRRPFDASSFPAIQALSAAAAAFRRDRFRLRPKHSGWRPARPSAGSRARHSGPPLPCRAPFLRRP